MKVLLVYPGFLEKRLNDDDVAVIPMGLYYIGALLRENKIDVQLLNLYEPDSNAARINDYVAQVQPDIVGFSIVHANRWGGIDMAAQVKALNPEIVTVFGGVGATFLWEYLLSRFSQIDYVIIGEGEYAFLELVRCIETKDIAGIKNIPGLAGRENDQPLLAVPAQRIDNLDRLPNPARYFTYQHVALSRGCPENCKFCGSPRLWERKVRFHSPEYFVDQLSLLYQQGVSFFYVSDDTFTLQKDRVIAVCRTIIKQRLPISWAAISRVDLVDDKILSWMRRAGCIQISYGVESGSAAIRKGLNKRMTKKQIKAAFALTIKYGIFPRVYFIYGCPGETPETVQASIDLLREIKPLGMVSYVLDIFPGTALYADYLKRSGLSDRVWDDRIEDILYFETDANLTASDVKDYGRRLRAAFHKSLPDFTRHLDLIDDPDFYAGHADFYSRLAMTFSHGDYAGNAAIPDAAQVAERLYANALDWQPDHRAFLGLGMIRQKRGAFEGSIAVLKTGLEHFPDSESLRICLGVSFMNAGRVDAAIGCFERYPQSPQAREFLAECYRLKEDKD